MEWSKTLKPRGEKGEQGKEGKGGEGVTEREARRRAPNIIAEWSGAAGVERQQVMALAQWAKRSSEGGMRNAKGSRSTLPRSLRCLEHHHRLGAPWPWIGFQDLWPSDR